jgi:mRNA interferase ChpB
MNIGCKTQGVAIMSMTRPVDLAARGARKVETAPPFVVDEAVAKFTGMFEALA